MENGFVSAIVLLSFVFAPNAEAQSQSTLLVRLTSSRRQPQASVSVWAAPTPLAYRYTTQEIREEAPKKDIGREALWSRCFPKRLCRTLELHRLQRPSFERLQSSKRPLLESPLLTVSP